MNETKMKILLLFANKYSIANEVTGVINEGVTLSYYLSTDLKATENTNGSVGMKPAKSSIPIELINKIVKAPALYEASFDMSIGSNGAPQLKVSDLDFVSEVELKPLQPSTKQ